MIRASLKYTRQNAVAFLALFVALSGTAFAATSLPKNSVGNKQIKKSAVTGVKVKKNTLTGTQINEAKLKTVPDASKLGGLPPSAYLPAGAAAANSANADKLDGIDSAVFGTAYTVPGSVFAPRDTSTGTTKAYVSTGSINAVGNTSDFHYAVHLPQGARVTGLDYRAIDNDGGSDSTLALIALNSIGEAGLDSDTLVSVNTNGSSASRRSFSGVPAAVETIDNTKWSYALVWSPFATGVGTQLVGGSVKYVVPAG
jgi:hypothetical protein